MTTPPRRLLAALLAPALLLAWSPRHARATSHPSLPIGQSAAEVYLYTHHPQIPYWHRSPHRYADLLGGGYAPSLYHLQHPTHPLPTYCCDLLTHIAPGTTYRRQNLEDATCYAPQQAAQLRGILQKGYWPGKNRLEALEAASGAVHLTPAEALSATQCAIWQVTSPHALVEIYAGTQSLLATDNIQDPTTVNPREGNRSLCTWLKKPHHNIQAVYRYLLAQRNTTPASVLWRLEDAEAILAPRGRRIRITVLCRMAGTSQEKEGLTLTAAITQGETLLASVSRPLEELKPSPQGDYILTLPELPTAALGQEAQLTLTLAGIQTVAEDVYFYEPYGGCTAAQAFVGYGRGPTPLHSQMTLPLPRLGATSADQEEEKPQPPASSEESSQPPASSGESSQPPASSEESSQPPASSGESSQPPASSGESSRPPASLGGNSQPPASSVGSSQPPASLGGNSQPPASSGEGSQPPASSGEGSQPPASSGGSSQPPASSGESPRPSASPTPRGSAPEEAPLDAIPHTGALAQSFWTRYGGALWLLAVGGMSLGRRKGKTPTSRAS